MQKSTEIELKLEIHNTKKLQSFLKELTFENKKRVKDVYLDTKTGELFKRGIFIRLRNEKTLDFKFNLSEILKETEGQLEHFHCDEYNFNLPLHESDMGKLNEVSEVLGLKKIDKADLETFKSKNHFVDFVIIDRERATYKKDDYTIVIDNVNDLGMYMEIEYVTEEAVDFYEVKKQMLEFLHDLEIKDINVGFVELFLRKHNFELYKQGKYLLDEDYIKFRKWC
jgi:adenylate cyclase class IV